MKKPIWEKLLKKLNKPPKLRVIPLSQTKDDKLKAKLLSKLLEYNWGTIEARIQNEIYKPTMKCFLYGSHKWQGCGKKGRHLCKICGWETWSGNNPLYMGEVSWDKIPEMDKTK